MYSPESSLIDDDMMVIDQIYDALYAHPMIYVIPRSSTMDRNNRYVEIYLRINNQYIDISLAIEHIGKNLGFNKTKTKRGVRIPHSTDLVDNVILKLLHSTFASIGKLPISIDCKWIDDKILFNNDSAMQNLYQTLSTRSSRPRSLHT